MIYAVFQQAVYRHLCAGIFTDLEAAKDIARRCALASDGHHTYQVVPFPQDQPLVDFDADGAPYLQDPVITEREPLFGVTRKFEWVHGRREPTMVLIESRFG